MKIYAEHGNKMGDCYFVLEGERGFYQVKGYNTKASWYFTYNTRAEALRGYSLALKLAGVKK